MRRFPDFDSLVKAKLMTPMEVKRLEKTDQKTSDHEATWAPILWAIKLLTKARKQGKIEVRLHGSLDISNVSCIHVLPRFCIYI